MGVVCFAVGGGWSLSGGQLPINTAQDPYETLDRLAEGKVIDMEKEGNVDVDRSDRAVEQRLHL